METLMEESQQQKETNPTFKPGGSHIQIDSISIEISSGEINESVEECNHFSIRGFVSEVRKKDSRLCSPFISDGDGNDSNVPTFELPPMDVRKFRSWRCSSCLQECNSSQGTSKEIEMEKSISYQNSGKQRCLQEGGFLKGLSKLFARAGADGFINDNCTSCQRSAKGKQLQEDGCSHEMSKEIARDLLCCCGSNQSTLPHKLAKGKRLLQEGFSQGASKENEIVPFSGLSNGRGASFVKSVNEAVMVPFNGLNFGKGTSLRKSDKEIYLQDVSCSQGMSRVVMGPPGGFAGKANPKSSKERKLQKSASSQGTSKEFAMPPPGGLYNSKKASKYSGKGFHLQHHGSSRGASSDVPMLPITRSIGKSTSSLKPSKQQNAQTPKHNIRLRKKGEVISAATLNKKRNYAKRSVRQAESAGDKHEIHKGCENGFEDNSNQEVLQVDAGAMEAYAVMPKGCNHDKATLLLESNEELGSCNKGLEQISNFSTAGETPDTADQSLLECYQSVKDDCDDHSMLDEDGADNNSNSLLLPTSVEVNRLCDVPANNVGLEAGRSNMYEEEEEDYVGVNLRREPKFRLLSDVIAKYPSNVGKQPDNPKASPDSSHDISAVKVISQKVSEQSAKRKASPVGLHDTSTGRDISAKGGEQLTKTKASPVGPHDTSAGRGVSVSDIWRKRKRSAQHGEEHSLDGEEHSPDLSSGGSKRISIRVAEPENKGVHVSHCRPALGISPEPIFLTDAKKQSKHIIDRTEAEKKSKKARFQNVVSSSVASQKSSESKDNYETSLASGRCSSAEAAVSIPFLRGHITDARMDKSLNNALPAEKAQKVHGYGKRKNAFPEIEECQTASQFLQSALNAVENFPEDGTSGGVLTGNGPNKRDGVMEISKNSMTALSTEAEYHQNSILTGKDTWNLQVEDGGTLEECKAGEGSSCAQKGKTAEAKGRVKDIDINSIPIDDKTPEQGSTDDIPMEIVELLAKHQYERRCDANKDKISLVGPIGNSSVQKSYTGMLKPQASYAGNGFCGRFEVTSPGKQKLSDNFEASRNKVLVGYPKDSHFCARFTGYTQSQGHVPGGAQYSSSVGSTAKGWNGNTMPFKSASRGMLQPVPSFNRYQGGLSQPLNTQIWPPMMPGRAPLGGPANQGMHARGSEMLHKGKINQGTVPFNFDRVTTANQSSTSPQSWNSRISEYANGGRQKATDFIPPKGIGSVDLSPNETIPALQLLNLVQVAGTRTSTPPVNRNAEFLKKLPFDHPDNQYKQYAPGPHFEPYKPTGSSSRHPLYDSEVRTSFVDKRCQCSSALPGAHMFPASAFQNEPNVSKSGGLKNPLSFTSQDQRNMGAYSYDSPVGNLCFDKSTTPIYSIDKKRQLPPAVENAIGRGPPSSSINIVQPIRKQVINFAAHRDERDVYTFHKAEVCLTNRNPAEILDLKEVRNFMIGPEDLRSGKGTSGKSVASSRLGPTPKRPQIMLKGKGRERLQKSDSRFLAVDSVTKS